MDGEADGAEESLFNPFADGENDETDWTVSRRDFVKGAGAVTGAAMLEWTAFPGVLQAQVQAEAPVKKIPITITINGEKKNLSIDPRISLLDLIREDLKMTGTKKGCDHGQCGACTVLLNGRRVNSCLALAVVHQGESVTTIEGIAQGETLDPVQQAFLEHDGFQCGYCTPGQILSAVALLDEARKGAASVVTRDLNSKTVDLSADEIRERMSGNICRCGAYPGIVAAVRQANGAKQEAAKAETKGDQHAAI